MKVRTTHLIVDDFGEHKNTVSRQS